MPLLSKRSKASSYILIFLGTVYAAVLLFKKYSVHLFGEDKWDTPVAAPPPCRSDFLLIFARSAQKCGVCTPQNPTGRTAAFLAPLTSIQNKKAIPFGMTFCFGGDKRDRTADLMTASHALSRLVRLHTPLNRVKRALQYAGNPKTHPECLSL